LLGRLVVIPYYPLNDDKRILENHKVPFGYDDEVVKLIVSRCTELESGGRMVDAILTNTVLPHISEEFLQRMMEGKPIERVRVSVRDGDFAYAFE
jgi:type VI secretion system protein VasG